MNVAVLAFPLYVLLIVLELAYERYSGRHTYRLSDASTSIYTALLRVLLETPLRLLLIVPYAWLYEHVRWFSWDVDSPWAWLLGFVLVDFCFYWSHRSMHGYNLLWGAHQPHHSSEDFNLSTALRKGAFQTGFDWPFYLPLALLGIPLPMFLLLLGCQLTYQFWVHSQHVGKLGWLEKVLVTPSLHRVHHGQNDCYIDKNHGGVLIIWDRLFGTHADEVEPVRYGVTTPVSTFDPLRLQFSWWRLLWADACATRRWRDKLRLWWMPTGWRPQDVQHLAWPSMPADKYPPSYPLQLRLYAGVQLVLISALALLFLFGIKQAAGWQVLVLGALTLWGCISLGRLFDGARHVQQVEGFRLLSMTLVAVGAALVGHDLGWPLAGLCAADLLWFVWLYGRSQRALPATTC